MTRGRARLVSLLGLLLALTGLAGYWLTLDLDRRELTAEERELIVVGEDDFYVSFVIAGRDIHYDYTETEPVYNQAGEIISWNWTGTKSHSGPLTDTILYVAVRGNDISLVAIPRDTFLPDLYMKANAVYHWGGPDELREQVAALLGVPIEYYAIIKLDIFEGLVDALGGVTIDIPYAMHYNDNAGGLHISFEPGVQHLSGEQASKFIRYRELVRGDIDRIENVKRLAYAMLGRVKELNVRAVTAVPALIDTFLSDVETNASVNLVRELAARLGKLELSTSATLPIADEDSLKGLGSVVIVDSAEVNRFMASVFGGVGRDFTEAPDVTLLITDQSGVEGVADWYVDRLVAFGIPEDAIITRALDAGEATPTRLRATQSSWADADYYADLLNVGKQQVDRFSTFRGQRYHLELVLGADAESRTALVAPHIALLAQP